MPAISDSFQRIPMLSYSPDGRVLVSLVRVRARVRARARARARVKGRVLVCHAGLEP
jgi:hypothetical protein